MILVADNDALLKLSAYDLWAEACAALGAAPSNVRTLVEARFVIGSYRRRSKHADRYTVAGLDRALEAVAAGSPVEQPAREAQDALTRAARSAALPIDVGEAVLFASAAYLGADVVLTTGDKRAVRALASVPGADDVRQRLAGRVYCVEHVLHRVVEREPFEDVRRRVRAVPSCDEAICNAFGRSRPAPAESVRAGLRSEVEALRRGSGALLASW